MEGFSEGGRVMRVWWLLPLALLGYVLWEHELGARLWPTTREVIVRQVENGYVVEAHTRNNPYPYKEYVFTDPATVGSAVSGLLNERTPGPLWGH